MHDSAMKPIRVLIIEDSRAVREFLQHIISSDSRLQVIGAAETAEEGIRLLPRMKPDVVSMDIRLPGMNGFEATRKIMSEFPTPIVVVSASVEAEDLKITMNALKAGALAVVEKPVGTSHQDYELLAQRLCAQLAIMSQVPVVRQRFNQRRRGGPSSERDTTHALAPLRRMEQRCDHRFIGLVASTGGPRALQKILSALPADFPAPIAVVQHITANFHEGFVHWLDDTCSLGVQSARHLQRPSPGHVYIAPPDYHLTVSGNSFLLRRGEPVCLERPSGSVLLESIADAFGSAALGVVLTGMGEDGASGLAKIRDAGGYTIAEAQSTAVVYGMPAAAVKLSAVCENLPLEQISRRLVQLAARPQEVLQ